MEHREHAVLANQSDRQLGLEHEFREAFVVILSSPMNAELGTPATATGTINVLANDRGTDGTAPGGPTLAAGPEHGTAQVDADNSVFLLPNATQLHGSYTVQLKIRRPVSDHRIDKRTGYL